MDQLNCLCASENQVLDEVEDFDDISTYQETMKQRLYLENFMTSYHFDGFEQGDDESTNSLRLKDTPPALPMMPNNTPLTSLDFASEQDVETRQEVPRGNRGHKRVNSMDSQHISLAADTCTTVSLSQSFMYDHDENDHDKVCSIVTYDDEDDDEVCSTVTTDAFQSKGRTDSNHDELEEFRFLLRMKPDNYIREN
jgi:hypothetical protein